MTVILNRHKRELGNSNNLNSYQAVMLALLMGDRGSGTLGGSGGGQHQHLQRPQPYLVDHGALLVLPRSSPQA